MDWPFFVAGAGRVVGKKRKYSGITPI